MRPPARLVRLSSILTAAVLLCALPAHAETFTSFQARAEGCSGGGNVCGGFPLVPAGSAAATYHASSDGSVDVSASVDRGVPSPLCRPGVACVPAVARYHAEAVAEVWVDVPSAVGAHRVDVAVAYEIGELTVARSTTVGNADASLIAAVEVTGAAQEPVCSDGSDGVGTTTVPLVAGTPHGSYDVATSIACEGSGATLSAGSWRVRLSVRVAATTDGGSAEAHGRAGLTSVDVAVS